MPQKGGTIYKTAREFAGLTQERASVALHLSVRSLAAYETGERIPADDVVVGMVDCYNYPLLAVQHLRQTSTLARNIVPELEERSMLEASIRIYNRLRRFAESSNLTRLIDIAEDGCVDESEQEEFYHILSDLREMIQSGLELQVYCRKQ